jgi:hypothetical protein
MGLGLIPEYIYFIPFLYKKKVGTRKKEKRGVRA